MPAPPRSAANARKISETDDDVLTRLEGGATQRALGAFYGVSRSSVRAAARRATEARALAVAEARRPTSRPSQKAKEPERPTETAEGKSIVYTRGSERSENAFARWLDRHDYAASPLGKDALARQAAEELAALRAEQEARTGMRWDPDANDGCGALIYPSR